MPPPQLVDQLVDELAAGEDRTVVPVRVFWVPGGLPTRVKLVGLISGRDTYRPPEMLQRAILRKDPSRARIVAGEPAKVSELRQQWRENTVGDTPAGLRQVRAAPRGPGDRAHRIAVCSDRSTSHRG